MDVFQLIVTTAAIVLVLVMVYFVCQLFGPRANAWVRSSREEKIGLSQKKLYNANGFLIRSGSDFLLSSTGSFKRFDSVDRDCKQQEAVSSLWSNLPAAQIPGQPLRPAPSPPPSSSSSAGSASTSKPHFFASHSLEQQQPHHPHPIKQQSWAGRSGSSSNSPSPSVISTTTVAVPRPKRQFSTPVSSTESANKLLPSFSFSPTRIKLHSRDPKELDSSPTIRTSTNPFLQHDEQQEGIGSVIVLPVAADKTSNPSSQPDLVSDSVAQCQRVWWSTCAEAEQSVSSVGSNPFFVTPQKQLTSQSSGSENSVVSRGSEPSTTTANVETLSCEALIFNFESIVPPSEPSTKVSDTAAKQSTGPATMDSNLELISVESRTTSSANGPASEHSEGVSANALLRQAEGSIRKLELAQEAAEGEQGGASQSQSSTSTFLTFANTNKMNSPSPGSSPFYEPMTNSHHQKHSFNRMTKYTDSFLSTAPGETSEVTLPTNSDVACDEDELIFQCSRRYRSHSETEATIFERSFALSQHRRLTLLTNNPFLGPNLLPQHANNSSHHNYYQQQQAYKNSTFAGSPARNSINKTNNPHQRWCSSNNNNNKNSAVNSNPYNPVMSKTLSETYLGQFIANSSTPTVSLPRSSSILMLLEQHQQQQHHGPPLSPTLPPWACSEGNEGREGCGSNDKSSAKSQWTNSEKVNVYASGTLFKRTLSSESVSSESSVLIADLESSSGNKSTSIAASAPPVTGYLCVGLQYDKNNVNEEGAELVVTVLEAKELLGPTDEDTMDTFVRIYLVPDEGRAMQTKLFKNSSCPSYNETFSFWVTRKHPRHSLWFHLYHSGLHQHTLIGEGEFQIGDVKRPLTTWIALSDSRHANSATNNFGELMFSLSYLPTAERLTVVVVKGRNLQSANEGDDEEKGLKSSDGKQKPNELSDGGESSSASSMSLCEIAVEPKKRHSCTSLEGVVLANVLVKVYLLKDGKKVVKKKTTMKRMESSPIYNESMIFSVPPYMLGSIQIRLTVAQISPVPESSTRMQFIPIGHVIVGNETTGKGLKHWNQMMTSLRKPVAMWHQLRRCSQTIGATGSPEQSNCTTKNSGVKESGGGTGAGGELASVVALSSS